MLEGTSFQRDESVKLFWVTALFPTCHLCIPVILSAGVRTAPVAKPSKKISGKTRDPVNDGLKGVFLRVVGSCHGPAAILTSPPDHCVAAHCNAHRRLSAEPHIAHITMSQHVPESSDKGTCTTIFHGIKIHSRQQSFVALLKAGRTMKNYKL